MSLRTRIVKSVFTLGAGRLLGELCSFTRNIIIARMLTPADVGIGATFWITVAMLQMISDLASDRLLIQAQDGEEQQFQDTLHLFEFGRGLLTGSLLFILAWPVAYLFKTPQALWAFQCVALVPILRGCSHLDIKRFHRKLRFRPQVMRELTAQFCSLTLAYPLCRWLGDYSAVLAIVLIQELVQMVGSHVASERRYRWTWSDPYVRRLFAFGWPLMANGLLLFVIMRGDRLIIGTAFSTHDLGLYTMAFILANAPFTLLSGVLNPIVLPLLSEVQNQPVAFQRRARLCNSIFVIAAGIAGIPMLLCASWLLTGIYGMKYEAATGVFSWLVAARMIWLFRVAPTLTAMACADTHNTLLANLFRLTGVGLAVLAAVLGYRLEAIAVAALVGECIAAIASVVLVKVYHRVSSLATLMPVLPLFIAVAVAHVIGRIYTNMGLGFYLGASVILSGVFACGMFALSPTLRLEIAPAVAGFRARIRWRIWGVHRQPE